MPQRHSGWRIADRATARGARGADLGIGTTLPDHFEGIAHSSSARRPSTPAVSKWSPVRGGLFSFSPNTLVEAFRKNGVRRNCERRRTLRGTTSY
jgi:hypothetical protein